MITLNGNKQVNPAKLHYELASAGIPVVSVHEDGIVELDDAATETQQSMTTTLIAGHSIVDDAQVIIDSALTSAKQIKSDFLLATQSLETYYNALTPAQRQETLTTITYWNTATVAQKADALLRLIALAYIGLRWLVLKLIRPY